MTTKTKNRTKKSTKSKKATSPKKAATKLVKSALTKKATKEATAKSKRISAIDAAAQVLKTTGKPMRAQELITAMAEQKLWTSPGGKTPHATLYAAILREINTKGTAARFTKFERGQFAFNAKAKG
jgi:short subunit dehydrogenase-like uncharacterized protein